MHAAAAVRRKIVLGIWDNASWHLARKVKHWIRRYNRQAKRNGHPRLLVWALPKRSPWLNPIEPHWMHAPKPICEPSNTDLSPHRLRPRIFQALKAKFIAALAPQAGQLFAQQYAAQPFGTLSQPFFT